MKSRGFVLVLLLGCVPLAACNQQHATRKEAKFEARRGGMFNQSERHRGRGLRRVCAADLQKLCPNEDRGRARRDCLQSHLDQLSADCKSAVAARGDRHRRRDDF